MPVGNIFSLVKRTINNQYLEHVDKSRNREEKGGDLYVWNFEKSDEREVFTTRGGQTEGSTVAQLVDLKCFLCDHVGFLSMHQFHPHFKEVSVSRFTGHFKLLLVRRWVIESGGVAGNVVIIINVFNIKKCLMVNADSILFRLTLKQKQGLTSTNRPFGKEDTITSCSGCH